MITTIELKRKRLERQIKEELIRKSLKPIILMLLKRKQMTGFEIIKFINERFGVLLNPSAIYPILHFFQSHELIQGVRQRKSIKYKIKRREDVNKILHCYYKTLEGIKKICRRKA